MSPEPQFPRRRVLQFVGTGMAFMVLRPSVSAANSFAPQHERIFSAVYDQKAQRILGLVLDESGTPAIVELVEGAANDVLEIGSRLRTFNDAFRPFDFSVGSSGEVAITGTTEILLELAEDTNISVDLPAELLNEPGDPMRVWTQGPATADRPAVADSLTSDPRVVGESPGIVAATFTQGQVSYDVVLRPPYPDGDHLTQVAYVDQESGASVVAADGLSLLGSANSLGDQENPTIGVDTDHGLELLGETQNRSYAHLEEAEIGSVSLLSDGDIAAWRALDESRIELVTLTGGIWVAVGEQTRSAAIAVKGKNGTWISQDREDAVLVSLDG